MERVFHSHGGRGGAAGARRPGRVAARRPAPFRSPPSAVAAVAFRRRDPMFDRLRESFRAQLDATARSADARRDVLRAMRESLVQARMGIDDLRRGVAEARRRRDEARAALATTERRRDLAAGIDDRETVQVAERFAATERERVAVLEQKLAAQEAELALVEREVGEMTADFQRAQAGVPLRPGAAGAPDAAARAAAEVDELLGHDRGAEGELDALGRARTRAARESEADARLAELKRRMGK